jgi:quinol monooxygenase YgiN
MTVIVTARLGPRKQSATSHDLLLEQRTIVAYMKEHGCLHHRVLELEEERWLMEEWESSKAFEDFFDRTPGFRQALREAGFREFPDDVSLWRPIDGEDELLRIVGHPSAELDGFDPVAPPPIRQVRKGKSNKALAEAVRHLLAKHPPFIRSPVGDRRFSATGAGVGKNR